MRLDQAKLSAAAADFRWLLDRGYPRRTALTLVGNRHDLAAEARELLHRGVFARAEAQARRAKLIGPDQVSGRVLGLDGHNVIITVESALRGRPLIRADDGVLRDIARLSAAFRPSPTTNQALTLIIEALGDLGVAEVFVMLDQRMSRSGDLAAEIRGLMERAKILGDARAVAVPEKELVELGGPVATSDSALMDQVAAVFDLAGWVAVERIPCDLVSLSDLDRPQPD
jgi:hypothetical protein